MRKDLRTWFAGLFLIGLIACAPTPRPPTATIARIIASPAPYMTETPIPTSTPKPTPTSLPRTGAAAAFDAARALEHNRFIAQEIGARPVGSDEDRRAGDYISDQFGALGYDVEWQEFTYDVWVNNNTDLQLIEPTKRDLDNIPLYYSPAGNAEGELVAIEGFGAPADFAKTDATGRIALVQRGNISFTEKVNNAVKAGAVAILIYNNAPGNYEGALDAKSAIPALALSGREGKALLDAFAKGTPYLRIESDTGYEKHPARNILARKRGAMDNIILLGAHYDSIETGQGAVANASGVAVMLELARVFHDINLKHTLVFAAFDAHQVGLRGSEYYASHLPDAARKKVDAMLDFDTVGGGTGPLIAGGNGRAGKLARESARALGIESRDFDFGESAASDHLPFVNIGIDSVYLARSYTLQRTPQDVFEEVREPLLAQAGHAGARLIEALDQP